MLGVEKLSCRTEREMSGLGIPGGVPVLVHKWYVLQRPEPGQLEEENRAVPEMRSVPSISAFRWFRLIGTKATLRLFDVNRM